LAVRLSALTHLGTLTGGDAELTGVQHDSRRVVPGDLFAAIRGATYDGHDFAGEAVRKGAVAVLCERPLALGVPTLVVPSVRSVLGEVAAAVYGHPAQRLACVGVTGTNGKTTTTFLLRHLFAAERPGLIGTVETVIGEEARPAERTTPEASDLQSLLARMVAAGCRHVFMEVSSHALVYGRVRGIDFRAAIFTNLTQDHLDFHGTMEAYREAKALLFRGLGPGALSLLNADDEASGYFRTLGQAEVLLYGRRSGDVRAEAVAVDADGIRYRLVSPWGSGDVRCRLTGDFNVYNTLAAAAYALRVGRPLEDVAEALATFPGVPGRFERIDEGQPFLVVVDYAHTPDGLENVLATARRLARGRVLVVFGCGGDRDRQKRPRMGAIAARLADRVFVTSDNPRSEDPEAILNDILAGVPPGTAVVAEPDRREAIFAAVAAAQAGDVVVIAGKGHETYQIFRDRTVPFDDRRVAREALHALARG
jgi:UDP-N-acetylmuramoyl-L-alanyl-D-glutamate--2,6-diaminopimelate ligase